MPIQVLQYVFHVDKASCTHKFFHKYEKKMCRTIVARITANANERGIHTYKDG